MFDIVADDILLDIIIIEMKNKQKKKFIKINFNSTKYLYI